MKKVAVVMGSDSDLPVVEKAINCLKNYGVPVEVRVLSAHRTPKEAAEFAAGARENGFGAIIAAAGKAAHLGGLAVAFGHARCHGGDRRRRKRRVVGDTDPCRDG